jgi:hypothetical protein
MWNKVWNDFSLKSGRLPDILYKNTKYASFLFFHAHKINKYILRTYTGTNSSVKYISTCTAAVPQVVLIVVVLLKPNKK